MTLRLRYIAFCLLAFSTMQLHAQIDSTGQDTLELNSNLVPTFTIAADDIESESQSQDISGLLQSSKDVFVQASGFRFFAARFRQRGYSSENYTVMLNGAKMNDPESGWGVWSLWGGLNDITRYPESRNGIAASPYHFGGVGGFSNISLRASEKRAGNRVSYAITNRTYRHRIMATTSTGLMQNNWAYTVSLSGRYSEEGYVEGTSYNGVSYFLSAERKINDNHSLGLVGMGAAYAQGRQGIAIQEAYDLTGNNFYNPYWGYQNGEKRNARIRTSHRPIFMLSHYWEMKNKGRLNTSLYHMTGKFGNTSLNWQDAKDPRPDYYRYLPSYNQDNQTLYDQIRADWQDPANSHIRQIDWDQLYFANKKNLYQVENANGVAGSTVIGARSKYIVEEWRQDPRQYGLATNFNKQHGENGEITAGLNAYYYQSQNFKVVEDLLGGDFWLDIDNFAQEDSESDDALQNDLSTPNKTVVEGDRFGYDYTMNSIVSDAFFQYNYAVKKVEVYGAVNASYTSYWREGKIQKGLFPESFGKSETHDFINYGVKGGALYKITGRHIVRANGFYQTRAPYLRDIYLSPRSRDQVVSNLDDTEVLSADFSYLVRYPKFKARATLFYTEFNNQIWNRSFYHDDLNSFVNYSMTGVDHLHQGVEVGFSSTVFTTWTVDGAFTTGQYIWNSRPSATITRDNSEETLAADRTIYLKNYPIGAMPQTAATIGLKYNSPKYWFAGASANYFDDIFLPPNPDRRTEEAVTKYVDSDPQWNDILQPTELEYGYTIDVYGGKSWKIKDKYLRLFVSVTNVLNEKDFATGGYEQLRYDSNDIDRFPPKLGYMYGTAYFCMLTFLF